MLPHSETNLIGDTNARFENTQAFSNEHKLSPCEKDVLGWVCQGLTNKKIAEKLFVVEATVKFHLRNIYKKTGCKSRAQLIVNVLHPMLPS